MKLQEGYPPTSDPRELMARRLKDIFADAKFNEPQPFLAMADEVLRQMAWARSRAWVAMPENHPQVAPDDWTP